VREWREEEKTEDGSASRRFVVSERGRSRIEKPVVIPFQLSFN